MMLRKIFLLIHCVYLSTIAYGQQSERPNILWIVSEDNSPFIGAYGDSLATTPNIDQLAKQGIMFNNAYCTAAVCAPSRSTLITGMYPPSIGTENMTSEYPSPDFVRLFPAYLKQVGYYTTNNAKKHYNTVDQPEVWDESSKKATYKNRKEGQPFFAVFNIETSHESSIFDNATKAEMYKQFGFPVPPELREADAPLRHDPERIPIPAYLPKTEEMKHDWALYYDRIEEMDKRVGDLLRELDEAGLADNTIVFYYGDNGGVLGRSKRFMFESGLRIPLIVRFPSKYGDLNPYGKAGSSTDRFVDFADFAPTVLNLAGVSLPGYFQGKPFLGSQINGDKDVVFGFRGRMDERFDLVRTIRKGRYRYVRNFFPNKPYGQHVQFLWLAKSMQSWEREYHAGKLNDIQSRFFRPKPTEELYDVEQDPENIRNLADDPSYYRTLDSLRQNTRELLIRLNDVGFIPEGGAVEISKKTSLYDYGHSEHYDIRSVLDVAYAASDQDPKQLPFLLKSAKSDDPVKRYWSAVGLTILKEKDRKVSETLRQLSLDSTAYVRIAAAEGLYQKNIDKINALEVIGRELRNDNTMLRLQALNALVPANSTELKVYEDDLKKILVQKASEYDVKAAYYLLQTKLAYQGPLSISVKW